MADYDESPEDKKEEVPIVNDKPQPKDAAPKQKGFRLFPDFPKKEDQSPSGSDQPQTKGYNTGWKWIKDWSDLLIIFPIMAIGFSFAKYWILWLDPTAQVLNVDNLSVLNFNAMMLFGGSGAVFVLYKIYIGGAIFPEDWDKGMTPFQVMIIKTATLAGIAIFTAFFLTRNL